MKIYHPFFSIVIIIIQFVFSLRDYFKLKEWREANPELNALVNLVIRYDTLFMFVLVIGIYEMLTAHVYSKILIRTVLVGIVFGYQFSGFIPIEDFDSGVYNTAWFCAILAFVLIVIKLVKYYTEKNR